MASITLRLFGAVEMRDAHGRELHSLPSQPKRFGLLSYLAVAQPPGFHSRDKLMGLFWPEATREQARHSLNQALHVLRTELGDEVIRSRGDTDVAIEDAVISCDVVEFELALEDGELERALELYRGDLLEGMFVREAPEFERWLEDERTRLREAAAGAAWALAHEHIRADRLVDAERTAQRALLLVPTDEGEVRRFIQALAHAGDRAAAVRFYEKFAQRLRSEYEIEPDPATAAVAAALTKSAHAHQTQTASGRALAAAPTGSVSPDADMPPADAPSSGIAFMRSRKAMIGVAVAAVVTAVLGTELLLTRGRAGGPDPDRVLVVALADESGREEIAMLGRMTQDYIIQVLTDAGFAEVVDPVTAQVVSQNVVEAGMAGGAGEILALADEAGAGTVVSGSYYAEGDSIYIQTRITGGSRSLETVGPVVGSFDARSELVARLADAVVAAVATVLNHDIASFEPGQPPTTYEAFEAYAEGLEAYSPGNYAEAARLFERAAAADPTFHRAAIWAALSYLLVAYMTDDWPIMVKAESLIATLEESREELSPYERCYLDFVIAAGIRPSTPGHYEAVRCMVREAPGYDNAKRELALALGRVNRPAEQIQVLEELHAQRGGEYWMNLSYAYHMLGDHERELEAARRGRQQFPEHVRVLQHEAIALAALDRLDEVAEVVEEMRALPAPDSLGARLLAVAAELRVHGHRDEALDVVDQAIAWFQRRPELREDLGWALYQAERWEGAERLFEQLFEEDPESTWPLAALGLLAAHQGDRAEAERIGEQLRFPSNRMEREEHTKTRARIAAVLGEREEAMTLLREWFDMGPNWDGYMLAHSDMDFESLHDYPPFQEFMRPKG